MTVGPILPFYSVKPLEPMQQFKLTITQKLSILPDKSKLLYVFLNFLLFLTVAPTFLCFLKTKLTLWVLNIKKNCSCGFLYPAGQSMNIMNAQHYKSKTNYPRETFVFMHQLVFFNGHLVSQFGFDYLAEDKHLRR